MGQSSGWDVGSTTAGTKGVSVCVCVSTHCYLLGVVVVYSVGSVPTILLPYHMSNCLRINGFVKLVTIN